MKVVYIESIYQESNMDTIVRSKLLLKYASQIFGDIVTDAYVILDSDMTKDEKKHDAICKINNLEYKDEFLRYDYTDIVLEFSNGKRVVFSNSEWAFISKLRDYEIYELSGHVNQIIRNGKISYTKRVNIDELQL